VCFLCDVDNIILYAWSVIKFIVASCINIHTRLFWNILLICACIIMYCVKLNKLVNLKHALLMQFVYIITDILLHLHIRISMQHLHTCTVILTIWFMHVWFSAKDQCQNLDWEFNKKWKRLNKLWTHNFSKCVKNTHFNFSRCLHAKEVHHVHTWAPFDKVTLLVKSFYVKHCRNAYCSPCYLP